MSAATGQSGRLAGRVAIVTGAGRGIGEAVARRFAAAGAAVVTAQRSVEEGDAVVAEIRAAGGEATAVATDVRDPASVEQMVAHAVDRFGRLDVLCNNAGVGLIATLVETSAEEYDDVMDVNARGVFLGMKYGIPAIVKSGGGSVINMASAASFIGFERDAAYCASKGAVLMLTRQAALDYAREAVRVNALAPGFVDTPMLDGYCAAQPDSSSARAAVVEAHPMGRLGTPDDVAGAALFLASDDSTWVTGAALAVDGGMTCQ